MNHLKSLDKEMHKTIDINTHTPHYSECERILRIHPCECGYKI